MDVLNGYYPGYNNTTYWNDTEEYDAYTPFTERPETYIVPVIFGLIFVVSIATYIQTRQSHLTSL